MCADVVKSEERSRPEQRLSGRVAVVTGAGRGLGQVAACALATAGARVGVAILSYDGVIAFGVTGDQDSVPEVDVVATGAVDELHDLLALATEAPSRTARKPRKPRTPAHQER